MLTLTLLLAGTASAFPAPQVLPKAQADHLCRLLVSDGESIMPLSAHAHRVVQPTDSLTSEQLFAGFLLSDDNWRSLRFFPHGQDDGTVVWYAPADNLPATLDAEHQKYISEVFPRMIAEMEAGNWPTVDAYIDRLTEYQCRFGGNKPQSHPHPLVTAAIFLLVPALIGIKKLIEDIAS